ncbi:Spermatoproteinsis associated protein 5 [Rhizopus azygosporus]|uniref:Spermatoproteinsis associated protein 5 n=1 Tax=Rhizopus azygosporus TaxID=86630 RepID=A0A367JZW4_RHIAZ|nr:Spermatoproteinsis associated protein 5 [Rhizopus azygosporus]
MQWVENVTAEIGGLRDLIKDIVSKISANKIDPCSTLPRSKGIILHGKPGVGKTALAISISKHSGQPYYMLNSSDIFSTGLTLICLVFYAKLHAFRGRNEIDIISGRASTRKSKLDIRIFSVLLHLIDQLGKNGFIIGTTSRLHAIDPVFIRSGRLDMVVEIATKLPQQRYEILQIITKSLPFESVDERNTILRQVSKVTHGFTPSDLQSVCSQVIFQLIRQQTEQKNQTAKLHHFMQALTVIRPSSLNEFGSRVPSVTFSDLYGLNDVIQELRACVIEPFHHPERYIQLGIMPPKGILLHGPTGVGKTMLCSALASEAGVNFMLVESSQIRSKIVGESEKAIAKLFAQARANSPCILFIDQIDMLLPKRGTSQSTENTSDRIVTSFLTEMDGLLTKTLDNNNAQIDLLVIAATNRIETMDPAVLRPGRFDERIHIPLPDSTQRLQIIKGISSKMPISLNDQEINELVQQTDKWSGAQLDNLFREAAMVSLRENVNNTEQAKTQ